MAIIGLVMTVAVLAVTVMSCISDVRTLRIPNMYSLIVLGCFPVAFLTTPEAFGSIWYHLASLAVMFALTYVMFLKGMMGGGDSKLGAALALWAGLRGLMPFVFYMALVGGVLGIIAIVLQKKKLFNNPKPGSWVAAAQEQGNAIPYGVAISFGAWMSFFHTGLFAHQLNEVIKILH